MLRHSKRFRVPNGAGCGSGNKRLDWSQQDDGEPACDNNALLPLSSTEKYKTQPEQISIESQLDRQKCPSRLCEEHWEKPPRTVCGPKEHVTKSQARDKSGQYKGNYGSPGTVNEPRSWLWILHLAGIISFKRIENY